MTSVIRNERYAPDFLFRPGAYFLSGTDTDVGKTFVGCLLAQEATRRGLRVGAYKPVASGFPSITGSDGERLWIATDRVGSLDQVSPQRFAAPLAPELAAATEGKTIDEQAIFEGFCEMQPQCDLLLVEGAGGLYSPVSPTLCNADLAKRWKLPVVLVANWKLGVVHQTLSCLHAARATDNSIAAIILSETSPQPQLSLLENRNFLVRSLERFYRESPPPIYSVRFGATMWNESSSP